MLAQESTTEVDPRAMSSYEIAIILLIEFFDGWFKFQNWFEDSGNAFSFFDHLKKFLTH